MKAAFMMLFARLLSGLLLGISFLQLSACSGSPLQQDESVFFFPTSANQQADGSWNVPIHHWVFEHKDNDLSRIITQKALSEIIEGMGVSEEQADSLLFKQRLRWFLVDNESNKKLQINLAGKLGNLSLTKENGHAKTNLSLDNASVKRAHIRSGEWLSFLPKASTAQEAHLENFDLEGQVQLIPATGFSVISDIDDTIKISNVLDKKALIKNTFVEPYRVTEGFPDYYKKLKEQGAYFHYVSASPWQLYPSLKPFMDKHYPQGTVSLRDFRLKDASLIKFLQSSVEYKTKQIKQIIERYPQHKFILIGDSGEHDPEVYADIYKQFPKNIRLIQIRVVEGSDLSDKRFLDTFKEVPRSVWQIMSKKMFSDVFKEIKK